MVRPAMTAQQERFTDSRQSALQLYRDYVHSGGTYWGLLGYELYQLLASDLPGALGFLIRRLWLPRLISACGTGPAVGRGMTVRGVSCIKMGRRPLLDDYSVLDARGEQAYIELGDFVSLGRGSAIVAKNGSIVLAAGVNVGAACRIATQSRIEIGESTLIAGYSYIGPGNHQRGDDDRPLISQEMEIKGGVRIGREVWIGARATILDGVTIGDGAIVGAHSLVKEDVPAGAVAVGTPARIVSNATIL